MTIIRYRFCIVLDTPPWFASFWLLILATLIFGIPLAIATILTQAVGG